ncbi:hypothetical protein BDQ17DRAFT_1441288 [Cyathus striatus]|nr:hypothetical protein BDQ17DRAFT_1441288 [Cyathus striatus]
MSSSSNKKVAYYYDSDVGAYTYGLGHPMKPHRIRVTHELVTAYNMLPKMHVLRPRRASPEAMSAFHTDEYVHFLNRVTPETAEELTYHGTRFLVGEDNPAFDGVFEFCTISAGGSIAAANRITSGGADICINWAGGLHHAKKREASGFCYINDIVLGVWSSYGRTPAVMTCSFHKFGEYFPGTGTQEDKGRGKGKGYAVNVPLKDGITDESYKSVFEPVIAKILAVFQPSAVVLQCGSDSLSGDKLGCFNLSMKGHAHCVQFLRKQNVPLILLGGGGYTVKNVARTWTYETACALGMEDEIDPVLPWNQYFEWFGPRYRLEVVTNNMDDLNVKDGSLDKGYGTGAVQSLACAPSVQMQDTPRESVGQHLGFAPVDEQVPRDDLDEKLAQHARYVYNLQESDTLSSSSPSSSEDEWDSDSSTSSRRRRVNAASASAFKSTPRKRMSLLTGQYYDVPVHEAGYEHFDYGKGGRRRFFQSSARWDEDFKQVLVGKMGDSPGLPRGMDLGRLMERGGKTEEDGDGEEWDEGMAVDA